MATLSPTPPGGVSADNFFGRQWTARTGLWLQRQTTLARRRLGWQKLTENDRRLQALKNRHRGERAFLIGNGPSLRVSDLDQLCGEITFAANKIFLAFPETRWRPTYYHVSDTLVAYNNAPRIRALETPCNLFADCCQPWLGDCQATWLYEKPRRLWDPFAKRCRFSRNLLHGVDGGGTVIYHQLQVAWMMGIREIYLIGLDFDFKLPSQPSGLHCPQGQVLVGEGEVNHFHPDYRAPGETWMMPRLDQQRRAFALAHQVFTADGGSIHNASRHTHLDVLPRIDLDQVLASPRTRTNP